MEVLDDELFFTEIFLSLCHTRIVEREKEFRNSESSSFLICKIAKHVSLYYCCKTLSGGKKLLESKRTNSIFHVIIGCIIHNPCCTCKIITPNYPKSKLPMRLLPQHFSVKFKTSQSPPPTTKLTYHCPHGKLGKSIHPLPFACDPI